MDTYLVWLRDRDVPIEIPANTVSWKDNTTVRFGEWIKKPDGGYEVDNDGRKVVQWNGIFWTNNICGFSLAARTAQY
jgi:hypothetical protein